MDDQQQPAPEGQNNTLPEQQNAPPPASPEPVDPIAEKKVRFRIAMLGFILFLVFVIGLFWFASNPKMAPGLTLSFIAGLSMIFLPCTLPMAFVIVPLCMGKNPVKGLLMAISFGLGLSITLSFYGVAVAGAGAFFGLTAATQFMLILGGGASLVFGLSEIGLLKFRLPAYSGKFPDWIQKQGDFIKVFLLGLFLGNAGVGCPNPAFYVLLGYVATVGDLFNGWILLFVHGLGRAVPLIFLAILGVIGINATHKLVGKQDIIERYMGWILIVIGSFITTFGLFGHDWFVASGIHTGWEKLVVSIAGDKFGENILQHTHKLVDTNGILQYGNMFFLAIILVTIILYKILKKPPKGYMRYPITLFIIVFLLVGAATNWTWKFGQQGPHGPSDAASMSILEGAKLTPEGTIVDRDGNLINGAHVMGDGKIMLADGTMPNATIMPDNTIMVMGMESGSTVDVTSLPKYGPSDRIDELPYVMKDGVKEFQLTVDEFQWEYKPGQFVHAWGYNHQIPGPTIRVNEGDKVRVVVKNNLPKDATTVHWDGQPLGAGNWDADGVPGVTQKPINPGGTYTYEFDALSAGTHWYHSHGKNIVTLATQEDMGLSGVFITEPSDGGASYDSEHTLVLDDWNVLPNSKNAAFGQTSGAVPVFNTFTINGTVFPYTDPIQVKEGGVVLIRVVNAGVGAQSIYAHGHNLTLVAIDGEPVPKTAVQEGESYSIPSGGTADFLLYANNPGIWLLGSHNAYHAAGMSMLIEYQGFDGPTTDDLRAMAGKDALSAGVHIMADGSVMKASGEMLPDATVLGPGVVRLKDGTVLEGVMDMRPSSPTAPPATDTMTGDTTSYEGIEGIHIMADGTVMLGNGDMLPDAVITADGMIQLPDGRTVQPLMDMRKGGSMEGMTDDSMEQMKY